MIVIVDVNKIFSAAYAPDGVEAGIINAKSNIQFIAPDFIIDEFSNHASEISEATGHSLKETKRLFRMILEKVQLFDSSEIPKHCVVQAVSIVSDIDPDDAIYLALHLSEGHKIWTGDKKLVKGLLKKGYDICLTTSELRSFLYKK